MKIINIIEVVPFEDFSLEIKFQNGVKKKIDVKPYIREGISSLLKDIDYFKSVSLQNGFISWGNGFDFCPVFLYNLED